MKYFSVLDLGPFHNRLFSSLAGAKISFKSLTAEEAKEWLQKSVFLNVSEEATYIGAVAKKLQLQSSVFQNLLSEEEFEGISLTRGDQCLMVEISNLASGQNFSEEEISEAIFSFSLLTVFSFGVAKLTEEGALKNNRCRQLIDSAGNTIRVDISLEACSRFGFYSEQRIFDPLNNIGTVIGVGPETTSENARKVLWYTLDKDPLHRARVARGFNNDPLKLEENGFRD